MSMVTPESLLARDGGAVTRAKLETSTIVEPGRSGALTFEVTRLGFVREVCVTRRDGWPDGEYRLAAMTVAGVPIHDARIEPRAFGYAVCVDAGACPVAPSQTVVVRVENPSGHAVALAAELALDEVDAAKFQRAMEDMLLDGLRAESPAPAPGNVARIVCELDPAAYGQSLMEFVGTLSKPAGGHAYRVIVVECPPGVRADDMIAVNITFPARP